MDCQYDERFILKYLNRELDTPSRKAFEHHLKLCPKCMLDLELCHSRLNSSRRKAPKTIEWAPFPGEISNMPSAGDSKETGLDRATPQEGIQKADTTDRTPLSPSDPSGDQPDTPVLPKSSGTFGESAGPELFPRFPSAIPPQRAETIEISLKKENLPSNHHKDQSLQVPIKKEGMAPQQKAVPFPGKAPANRLTPSKRAPENKPEDQALDLSSHESRNRTLQREPASLDLLRKMAAAGRAARRKTRPDDLPPALLFARNFGSPLLAILALLIIMAMPSLSQPILGGLWALTDKAPVQVASEVDDVITALEFTGGFTDTDQNQLIASLNAKGTGIQPWQVLYADEEKVFIRDTYTVLRCQGSTLTQVADLEALNLTHVQGAALTRFSFSPTGEYLLAGNSLMAGETETGPRGVYLFETQTGRYAKVSDGGMEAFIFAWSFDGKYFAYSATDDAQAVYVFDTETKELTKAPSEGGRIKSLFISYSGALSIFSGNAAIFRPMDGEGTAKYPLSFEPVFIDPETRTAWFIQQGILKSLDLESGSEKVLLPSGEIEAMSQSDTITSHRISGNHLVFALQSGDAGVFHLQSHRIKVFDLDGHRSGEDLPWLDVSREGTRILLDENGSFIISNGHEVSTLSMPDDSALMPANTRWMDEENIVYVIPANPKEPAAGEFMIIRMSTATGKVTEWTRTADRDLEASGGPTIKDIDLGPDEDTQPEQEVFEKVKATGNWIETMVLKTSPVRNGPSDRYKASGEIPEGEILLYNNKAVNGWFLARSFSGSDAPYEFWIRSDSLIQYKRHELPAGIITEESVALSGVTLYRGNLIRIIRNEGSRSYVTADTIDVNAGITGWIEDSSYTTNPGGAYVNQSYLRSGSIIRKDPSGDSDPVPGSEGPTETDQFVYLTDQRENGFVYIQTPGGGLSGWVGESELFLPLTSETPVAKESNGNDLNGDGREEELVFQTDGSSYILTINNDMVGGRGVSVRDKVKIVDIDSRDRYLEIVVEEEGGNADYQSTFYHYNGQDIILMGQLPGLCGKSLSVKGNGVVLAQARGNLLETWYFQEEYKMNEHYSLIQKQKDFYQKLMYEDALPLTLMIPSLSFRTAPGSEAVAFTLEFGGEVRFVGSDNVRWCQFENNSGLKGWLEISGFWDIPEAGLPASDVFEGLNLAD